MPDGKENIKTRVVPRTCGILCLRQAKVVGTGDNPGLMFFFRRLADARWPLFVFVFLYSVVHPAAAVILLQAIYVR